jgi:hypothetical protein
VYQLIFDTSSLGLMVKMPKISERWYTVDLMQYFDHDAKLDNTGQIYDAFNP